MKNKNMTAVYCKTGATDLRRSEKALSEIVANAGLNPHDGSAYVFMNSTRTKMKTIQQRADGMVMVKNEFERAAGWFDYAGGYKRISGKEAENFFAGMEMMFLYRMIMSC
jgi:hypothetical protein